MGGGGGGGSAAERVISGAQSAPKLFSPHFETICTVAEKDFAHDLRCAKAKAKSPSRPPYI